jgi:type VI secretion system protein ImpJ
MTKAPKVVWTKGMFLLPQHFQAQDDYFEQALHQRAGSSNFANWGLSGIGVDEASLVNGVFTLRHGEGIFPDGLQFDMPLADDLPAGRQIEEVFPPTEPFLDVYLAVPQARPSAKNYSIGQQASNNGHSTRFNSETRMVIDATLGTDEKAIQVGKKSLRLLFGVESLDGFTTLRISQIGRSPGGTYILNDKFVPPLLDIVASDYLMMLARRQVEMLAAKCSSLSGSRRQKRDGEMADFTTTDVVKFWLLHTINSYLPELNHIWKVRRGHPDVLYRAMLRLAGALTTFAMNESVVDFPDYNHDDLGPCFTALDVRIRSLIEVQTPDKCVVVPLRLTDKLVWSGSIVDERHLKGTQFILSVSCKMPVEELLAKFPRLAKLSAPSDTNRLVRLALPGVPLRYLSAPPTAVPVRLDNHYFALTQTGMLWEALTQARAVSVFVPSEIEQPKMELLIVLP